MPAENQITASMDRIALAISFVQSRIGASRDLVGADLSTAVFGWFPRLGRRNVKSGDDPANGYPTVTEADTAAIRTVFQQEGDLSAAIEVRRLFPGVTDNATARAHARTIAGWESLPVPTLPRPPAPHQRPPAGRGPSSL